MKKFLAILLPAILVIVFTACSNEMLEKAGAKIKDELGLTNGTTDEYVPTGVTPAIGPDELVSSDVGYATSTDATE